MEDIEYVRCGDASRKLAAAKTTESFIGADTGFATLACESVLYPVLGGSLSFGLGM